MFDSPTYHLVCRDCCTEHVVDTAATAEQRAADHELLTGHRLDFIQVA